MLFLLAWKNVWRNKKRSLIILIAIALGLGCGLFASAVMYGMWDSTVNAAIDRDLSHIQIHTEKFRKENLIENYIPGGEEIERQIEKIDGVKAVSGRTIIDGMAASASSSTGVEIKGIIPDQEEKVTSVVSSITEGEYFEGVSRNPIVIGRELAKKLDLKLHSKIVLSFQGTDGNIIYAAFRISGIFETESSSFDKSNVFVKQSDLFNLLNSNPIIHEIAVRLTTVQVMDPAVKKLRGMYKNLSVETWQQLAPELSLTYETLTVELNIFLGIILFALLFGITNTMLMSVMERIRELGVLMAVGMKRTRVFILIIIETVFLSITGGIIGMLLGASSIWITAQKGINLSLFSQGLSSYGISSHLFPGLPGELYPILFVMIIITALISAVYPAFKAIRLNPASAIRTY
ncbi:MAG TPA: FtsX-like permease family protein [Ignavibacteriaceae bacterium]|jgi:putative ABC transport system permease protein|nr:FtsX-like permease family protein [Ignavibacteriaceae bacterium]